MSESKFPKVEAVSEFDVVSQALREHFQPPPPDSPMLRLLLGLAQNKSPHSLSPRASIVVDSM